MTNKTHYAMMKTCLFSLLMITMILPFNMMDNADAEFSTSSVQQILDSDGKSKDWFGYTVAVQDDLMVIGAIKTDDIGADTGSAHIYKKIDGIWELSQKLLSDNPRSYGNFGGSVDIINGTVLVGSSSPNSVSVFSNIDGTWTNVLELSPTLEEFEIDAISDTILLSDGTRIHVYENTGSKHTKTGILESQDGHNNDHFGWSRAVSNNFIFVSAEKDNENGKYSGAVYVYQKIDDTWQLSEKLLGAHVKQYFGSFISIDNDTLLIGAKNAVADGIKTGASFIYENNGTNWNKTTELSASDKGYVHWFGYDGIIYDDTILIGSPKDVDNGEDSGSVYLFEKVDDTWIEQGKIVPDSISTFEWFGIGLDYDGESLTVGVYLDNDLAVRAGSAFVFSGNLSELVK